MRVEREPYRDAGDDRRQDPPALRIEPRDPLEVPPMFPRWPTDPPETPAGTDRPKS